MSAFVVTGASNGIDAAYALQLDRLCWQVFAGMHKPALFAKFTPDRLRDWLITR